MKKFLFTVSSVFFIVGAVAAGVFVCFRAYKEMAWNKEISEEIRSLQADADRVEQENRKLRDRIEYLQSDSFREQEAKRVLEYQRSDEKVVLIRNQSRGEIAIDEVKEDVLPVVLGMSDADDLSNITKWWQEFFGKKQ